MQQTISQKQNYQTKETQFQDELIQQMIRQSQLENYNKKSKAIFDQYSKPEKQSFAISESRQKEHLYLVQNSQKTEIYRIKNLETGEYTIIFNEQEEEELDRQLSKGRNQIKQYGPSWSQFWKKLSTNNEKLMNYCRNGKYEQVKQLIEKGQENYPVQINTKNEQQQSALQMACCQGYHEIVQLLCMKKANVQAKNKFKKNGLHIACLKGHIQVAKVLIKYSIQINAVDIDGNTPLHFAVENRQRQIIRLLLQNHAQIIKNILCLSPLDICKDQEAKQIFKMFGHLTQPCIELKASKSVQILTIQSFTFHKIIGKGAFGQVYAATKKGDSRKKIFAIKVLRKDKLHFKNLRKFALAEKNIMSTIDHPFVVKLYYAFQSLTKLFLVMDYYPGGNLGDLIKKHNKLSQEQAKYYICELILALETLHKKEIIFRDLKPDNVMLDQDGHCRLTDFGLSKEGVYDNLTATFCGSVAYLAPQILLNLGHSRTIDWYLLGVLLYELLVGIPPYYNNIKEILFQNIKKGPLKMPKAISPEAKDLIKRLLSRDPKKRLGFQRDAQQVKEHIFFQDISWQQIFSKRRQTPLQNPKKIDIQQILPMQQCQTTSLCQQIQGWQFTSPDK